MSTKISEHFTKEEFACKDGCGFADIDMHLVNMLETLRMAYGPLQIVSGCRCEKHNKAVGGEPDSAHLKGKAADIASPTSGTTFKLVILALTRGFLRVGLYKGQAIVHVDVDETLPQSVMWVH